MTFSPESFLLQDADFNFPNPPHSLFGGSDNDPQCQIHLLNLNTALAVDRYYHQDWYADYEINGVLIDDLDGLNLTYVPNLLCNRRMNGVYVRINDFRQILGTDVQQRFFEADNDKLLVVEDQYGIVVYNNGKSQWQHWPSNLTRTNEARMKLFGELLLKNADARNNELKLS